MKISHLKQQEQIGFRLSPATSSIYIPYIRHLQSSLKDYIPYIHFLSNIVL
jgi:hypothetical protein